MALSEILAAAGKPTVRIWGQVGIGLVIAFVGASTLAMGVSRSQRTGKQSTPMTVAGLVLVFIGGALMYSFRK